ncbi:MAG: hypothetical protein JXA04_10065 [Gammaproteobacteria bacterium]|nr:hypothetical protein [Gammaproteobacteria bacterium]
MEQNRSNHIRTRRIFDLPQFRNRTRVFHDRQAAVDALTELLPVWFIRSNPILLAISGAGYILAIDLAERFGLDVDFTPVQNIVLPWDKDIDYAAVAFDGTVYLDQEMVEHNHLGQSEINKGIERAFKKMPRDLLLNNPLRARNIKNRNVLLVDEGVTTSAVARAAIKALKNYRSKTTSLAVTTAYDRALIKLSSSFEYIFCPNIRSGFAYDAADAYKQSVAEINLTNVALQQKIKMDQLMA